MKIRCYDIDWDYETEDGIKATDLPTEVIIDIDDDDYEWAKSEGDDCVEDLIVNELSEKFDWLVNGYSYEEVK